MKIKKTGKKVVLVGCGAVGTSFIYSCINQGIAEEYVLIDINKKLAEGHALDFEDTNAIISHPFTSVSAGTYSDCSDADVIVITAGRPQIEGETRLDMVADNAKIMKSIATEIKKSGFNGVTIIASNPVDIMTYVYKAETKFDKSKVIGSGTTLDSSRLKRLLAEKLNVSPKSVHAYIIGEHGDSSVPTFLAATVNGKPVLDYIAEGKITRDELEEIHEKSWKMGYEILNRKGSTYYGIGVALAKLTKQILRNERQASLVGALLEGEYFQEDLYAGVPAIIGKNGIEYILEIPLSQKEREKFNSSCKTIKENIKVAMNAIK